VVRLVETLNVIIGHILAIARLAGWVRPAGSLKAM
jgi:hypothetical protein